MRKNAYEEFQNLNLNFNDILWADIVWEVEVYDAEIQHHETISMKANLKSNRNAANEQAFVEALKAIDYDNGYGSQELFGYIMLKNGSWYQRYEYDGSEHWELASVPEEPAWE